MRKSLAGLVFGVMVATGFAAMAQEADGPSLKVGDQAPPLKVEKEWLKGDPITKFEAGKVYVVEFWATWCGPCRTSIPHLSGLQEQYKDKGVTMIGVDAFEQDFSEAAPFVKEMGDKMEYSVAMDSVPEGASAQEGAMAKNWMDAAGQNGIPTAFIVNQEGVVAWIGHPMQMDQPLEQIVAGDYDMEAAAKEAEEAAEKQAKIEAMQAQLAEVIQKIQAAQGPEDLKVAMPDLDAMIDDNEELAPQLRFMKFNLLVSGDLPEEAVKTGREFMEGEEGENALLLNNMAWVLVDPDRGDEKPPEAAVKFAREAAEKANNLTDNENWTFLDTLARAYFLDGDLDKALEIQEKTVKLAGDAIDENPDVKSRLEDYRKAAKK